MVIRKLCKNESAPEETLGITESLNSKALWKNALESSYSTN